MELSANRQLIGPNLDLIRRNFREQYKKQPELLNKVTLRGTKVLFVIDSVELFLSLAEAAPSYESFCKFIVEKFEVEKSLQLSSKKVGI